MRTDEELRCERDCTRLCYDFAWTVDHLDYDAFVALFAPEGVFDRGGQRSAGHAAIRAFLDARPVGRETRHVCSNVRIDRVDARRAVGTCLAVMYASGAADAPSAMAPPLVVDYTDEYVLTARGWRFQLRQVRVNFQP